VTQQNTLLNRNENGGTGVWSRKWRRQVANALALAPLRRGLGDGSIDPDLDDFAEGTSDGDDSTSSESWKVKVKPLPEGLKGCLKREGSFELTKRTIQQCDDDEEERLKTGGRKTLLSPIPSPAVSTTSSTDGSFYSPPLPIPSPTPSPAAVPTLDPITVPEPPIPEPQKRKMKTVSIQEPSLVELEALRALWDSPEMQSSVNGGNGYGGIAGYRRTRDHYARGQGGRGVNKGSNNSSATPPKAVISKPPSTVPTVGEELAEKEKNKLEQTEDSGSPARPRRPLNPSLTRSSSSSLSPTPITRRPLIKRALSPNSNGIPVQSSSSSSPRRRGLSPNNSNSSTTSGSSPLRTASVSPGPPSDRSQPRWIRSKKASSKGSASSTTASKSPVSSRQEEEEDERGGTGRNGTMSATVSDDSDSEGDYEDVPPTPPSQPSLALAMAPLSPPSSATTTEHRPHKISPSLELLLDHTDRSLETHETSISNSDSSFANNSQESHLPTPSPSPPPPTTVSPSRSTKPNTTPSFEITPATPDLPVAPLPPLPTLTEFSSSNSSGTTTEPEEEDDYEEDPNDPMSSPTVEAKGIVISPSQPSFP